jgi:hypothetical protein
MRTWMLVAAACLGGCGAGNANSERVRPLVGDWSVMYAVKDGKRYSVGSTTTTVKPSECGAGFSQSVTTGGGPFGASSETVEMELQCGPAADEFGFRVKFGKLEASSVPVRFSDGSFSGTAQTTLDGKSVPMEVVITAGAEPKWTVRVTDPEGKLEAALYEFEFKKPSSK